MKTTQRRGLFTAIAAPLLCGAVAFTLDRITKHIVMRWQITPSTSGIGRVITLVHHENHGIVANLPVPIPVIVIVTLIVLALVAVALVKAVRANQLFAAAALGILIGGALGNLLDRVTQGFVFDWILLFGRSAINLADASIVIGALWYLSTLAPPPKA